MTTEVRDPDRQCKGKRTYRSKSEAKKYMRRMVTKYGAIRYSTLSVYRCPHCNHWHYGHRPRPKD